MCRFWYWNRSMHIRCIFSTVFSDLIYRFELRPSFKQLWKVYAFSWRALHWAIHHVYLGTQLSIPQPEIRYFFLFFFFPLVKLLQCKVRLHGRVGWYFTNQSEEGRMLLPNQSLKALSESLALNDIRSTWKYYSTEYGQLVLDETLL